MTLIDDLKKSPSIGPSLEGKIFSTVCRGAREGCFFLKSASTSAGKSRTSIFDACHLAYPKHWSHEKQAFVERLDSKGNPFEPRKVLFIVTEMDKEELQTIMLAYLSGVDEDHILTGNYELGTGTVPGEYTRVKEAARIMEKYSGYEIQYVLTFLENCDVELYVYTLTPDGSYESRIYWDNKTGELKQFLEKEI